MAALSPTFLTARIPAGNLLDVTFRVAITNTGSADEWVVTGLSSIEAIVGFAVIGTVGVAITPNFRKNANGTGVAEGTNPGNLALECAALATLEVTVRGRP